MTTRNIVPRANSEGKLGTEEKRWLEVNADGIYANNMVLTFSSVEEMKASDKIKLGYTLKTLGFYIAGDGGGADYIVIDKLNTQSEADEASNITLQNGLYAHLILQDVLNVKQLGAYGDGEHDDTDVLKNKIFITDNRSLDGMTIYFPEGNYLISKTLETSSDYPRNIEMDINARIFTETEDLDFLIRLGRWGTTRWDGWFIGGILDCNNKGKSCLGASSFGKGAGLMVKDLVCKNFKQYGIHTNPNDLPSGGFKAYNINFLNDTPWEGSICVYNANADNFFKDLYGVGQQGGIETKDKITVDNFHLWPGNRETVLALWKDSFLIKVKGIIGTCKFDKCYADTLRYGWIGTTLVPEGAAPKITTVDCQFEVFESDSEEVTNLYKQYPPCVYDLQSFSTVRDYGSYFSIPLSIQGARIIGSSDDKYNLQDSILYSSKFNANNGELANVILSPISGTITSGDIPKNLKSGKYFVTPDVTNVPEYGSYYILEVILCSGLGTEFNGRVYAIQRLSNLTVENHNVYQRIVKGQLEDISDVSAWVQLT